MTTNKQRTIFATVLMLLFFICSSESLLVGTNSAPIAWAIYTKAHYVIFFLLLFRQMTVKGVKANQFFPMATVVLVVFMNYILAQGINMLSTYLHIATVIVNAWLIVQQFSFEKFAAIFEKAMYVMAIYSLVVYAVALVAPQIIRSLPVIENIAGNRYYSAGLAIISQSGLNSGTLFRSFGVFREPGMYQIFLNLAFSIYLFYQKGTNFFKIAVYILAVFSTVSTTGIIAILLIFIVFTVANDVRGKGWILILLIGAVVLLSSLVSSYDIFMNATTKLENGEDMSTVARLYSVYANLEIWLSYPIFGSGIRVNSELFPRLILDATNVAVADNTNTYMYLLSCFGIVPFSVFVCGLYRVSKTILGKRAYLLFLIFLVLLAGENFLHSSFMWVFAFYGLSSNAESQRAHRERVMNLESA